MATHTSAKPTPPTNGDARGPLSHTPPGNMPVPAQVNRKKQKRRQKQAARLAVDPSDVHASADLDSAVDDQHSNDHGEVDSADLDHVEGDDMYHNGISGVHHDQDGHPISNDYGNSAGSKSKKKKSKKGRSGSHTHADGSSTPLSTPSATFSHPPPTHSLPYPSQFPAKSAHESSIWNQSNTEERENIRTFWFELGEEERRQLVKVEKDAVLKKMKEQQKHSCSCTVCGRKRTAIEEELEVLYDAYYEELEQYANNNQGSFDEGAPIIPPPRLYQPPLRSPGQHTRTHGQYHPSRNRVQELPEDEDDEEEDLEDDYDEEEEEEEDEDDDELYSDEEFEDEDARAARADFFAFGNSLTVKDGILTVADDLLKNDGKHFIDMMEQLAERRMQREEDTQYNIAAAHQSFHAGHNHGPLDDEDYDDEEDEDYDSQEEEEFDEDEMDAMTEEQRMQEGRRMFQIFAARMFEQRVMTAYREKVAEQRQKQLLEELLEEENQTEQRNAKKAREAQKKKDKKRLQKQAKDEEKARRDAEKAAEEAAVKAAQEKKLEEQRVKREEQRKKREIERKAQEEERTRKEAEKQRRLKEDRERQAEAERKQREQKEEKKRREEAKRKEKEDREKKAAQEEQERKIREEQAKKNREATARAEQEARERAGKSDPQPRPAPLPGNISMPPNLQFQATPGSLQSPHYATTTPIAPKISTPVRPRQPSQQGSHTSSPHSQPSSSDFFPQPSISPRSMAQSHPGPIGGRPGHHQQQPPLHHPQPSAPLSPLGRGNHPGFPGFGGLPPNPPGLPGMGGRPLGGTDLHMYSPSSGIMNPLRPFPGPGGITAPPGMNGVRPMPSGRGFPSDPGHSFPFQGHHGMPGVFPMQQPVLAKTHSRQPSSSFERSPLESSGQSFQRPSPIKRPSSGTQDQQDGGHGAAHREVDQLSTQLGSSALLDDTDAQYSSNLSQSLPGATAPGQFPTPSRASFQGPSFFPEPLSSKPTNFAVGSAGWGSPFGGSAFPSASTWGATTGSGWPQPQPNNVFAAGTHHRGHTSRPVTIRLLVIQACKNLNTLSPQPGSGGHHNVNVVLSQVEQLRPSNEPAINLEEMVEICDTEGNHQNGGGSFSIKEDENGRHVKFEPDTNSAIPGHRGSIVPGDIGSPVPGSSHPAPFGGFNAPSVLRQYSSPPAGLYGGTS